MRGICFHQTLPDKAIATPLSSIAPANGVAIRGEWLKVVFGELARKFPFHSVEHLADGCFATKFHQRLKNRTPKGLLLGPQAPRQALLGCALDALLSFLQRLDLLTKLTQEAGEAGEAGLPDLCRLCIIVSLLSCAFYRASAGSSSRPRATDRRDQGDVAGEEEEIFLVEWVAMGTKAPLLYLQEPPQTRGTGGSRP